MAKIEITCPSGMRGTVRGLKGKEMNLLSDRKKARSGDLYDDLLKACWLETLDPCIYTFGQDVNWDQVLVGDRFYTLLQLRQATYPGEPYSFKVRCSDRECGRSFEWDLDLDDLPVKKLPEASAEAVKTGQPLVVDVDNHNVSFMLQFGKDEKRLRRRIKNADDGVIATLASRIHSVSDSVGGPVANATAWLEDLEFADMRNLLDAFDEHDCGVETSIEIECPYCADVQETQLPFEAGFFLPRK